MDKINSLMKVFDDPSFAWELLDCQIAIEMSDSINGTEIARCLALYMRGVEKMNSLLDIRQSYFKNRMTALMGKQNVIRSLNKAPMAKKNKPLEAESKSQPVIPLGTKPQETAKSIKLNGSPVQAINLQEKKKQIQLRLAYQAQQHSPQALKKMVAALNQKESKISGKIDSIMKSQDEKLNERLMKRKLKTATVRSRPQQEINQFTTNQSTMPGINLVSNQKNTEEQFLPLTSEENVRRSISKIIKRPFKSLDQKSQSRFLDETESPKKARRMTSDLVPIRKVSLNST